MAAAADAPVRGRHRPGRAPGRGRHAVPRGPRRRRRARAPSRRRRASPWRELVEADARARPRRRSPCSSRGVAVRRRTTPGGAGPEPVAAQLRGLRRPARRRPRPLAGMKARRLRRSFYARDPRDGRARSCSTRCWCTTAGPARIVEVEAYAGADDPGSHAFRGETPRNRVDVRPGRAPVRVLHLRHALVRQRGLRPRRRGARRCCCGRPRRWRASTRCASARPAARRDRDLCNGPAKLCQAFGLDGAHDGADLVDRRPGRHHRRRRHAAAARPRREHPHRALGRGRAPLALVCTRRPQRLVPTGARHAVGVDPSAPTEPPDDRAHPRPARAGGLLRPRPGGGPRPGGRGPRGLRGGRRRPGRGPGDDARLRRRAPRRPVAHLRRGSLHRVGARGRRRGRTGARAAATPSCRSGSSPAATSTATPTWRRRPCGRPPRRPASRACGSSSPPSTSTSTRSGRRPSPRTSTSTSASSCWHRRRPPSWGTTSPRRCGGSRRRSSTASGPTRASTGSPSGAWPSPAASEARRQEHSGER